MLLKNEGAKYNKCTKMDIVPKTTCTKLDVQCTEMCTELDMYRSGLFGTEVVMYRNLVYRNGHVPKVSCTELDLTQLYVCVFEDCHHTSVKVAVIF